MFPPVVIIGAGKIAASLIYALVDNNIYTTAVISRSAESAYSLAKSYDIAIHGDDYSLIPKEACIIFLTTPDSQLQEAANSIVKLNRDFKGTLFIHMSGAEDISVLNPILKTNASTASMHIMQTFPSRQAVPIEGSYAAIETDDADIFDLIRRLAIRLKLHPFRIPTAGKKFYHLSAVFISNFLIANFSASQELFNKSGIVDIDYFSLIQPILDSTIQNIKTFGPAASLSGVIDRGDVKTVKEHIDALRSGPAGDGLLHAYISNSLILLNSVESYKRSLNRGQKEIKEILLDLLKKY